MKAIRLEKIATPMPAVTAFLKALGLTSDTRACITTFLRLDVLPIKGSILKALAEG